MDRLGWPVCPLADIAHARRLRAALTYARRDALFTLLGIAGKDDLYPPDPCAPAAAANSLAMGSAPKPPGDGSASKLLEDAFTQKLSDLSLSETVEPAGQDGLDLPVDHSADAKLDCGNAEPDQARGIDKSVLTISTPKRYRNKEHLRFVARQPCLFCGRKPSDPHHLGFLQPRAMGRKASDEFAVPLCRTHHRAAHGAGDERGWWKSAGIDPEKVARKLWKATRMGEGDLSSERSVDARVPGGISTPVADPKLPARKPEPQRPDQDENTGPHVRGPGPDFTALADLVEVDPSAAPKIVPDHPGKQDEHEQNSGN
jgi:hypothetical protein